MQRAVEQASAARAGGRLRRTLHKVWPHSLSLPPAIYILTYHSVVDSGKCQPWETAYDKVAVTVENLEDQLGFLSSHTTPIGQSI